jgi:hypothetical protein
MDEGGSRDGVSLSEEAHCGGPRGRGKILGQAFLFMGAQLGNLEWAYLLGTLRDG